jgi:acetolactate synthase I/II/III large subunit
VKAGRAVVKALEAEGVSVVFGLPGGHVLEIYDGLYDSRAISYIAVRHEQSAANMAAAYAQLTGSPAVTLCTAGPGATNLVTGIAEAFLGALPVVAINGRGPTDTSHRGAAQEVASDRVFAPIAKWTVRVDRASVLLDAIRQGFSIARNGKPGPVVIDIPRDLLSEEIAVRPYAPAGPPARPKPDDDAVASAATALGAAVRPVIVAGGGTLAAGAWAELRTLAELTASPVLTSLAGRGSIPDDHPLSAGGLGAQRNRISKRLLAEADVVLNLGCRFEEMETNWLPSHVPAEGAVHIQVDIDGAEIGRSIPAQIGVVGDIRCVLQELLERLGSNAGAIDGDPLQHPRIASLRREMEQLELDLDAMAASDSTPLHPLRVIRAVRAAFPRETTVAIDVGCITQHIAGGTPFFKVYEPRSLIVPSSYYGMGFASSALPVAKLVYPDRPAVGFVGDGSFQMCVVNVLPVAVEHGLPVTWCVMNDQALGSIWDIQRYRYGGRILGTEFSYQPSFAAIAEACGCYGERIEAASAVDGALERALEANARGVPAVLDFAVARVRLPQTAEHYAFYPQEAIAVPGDDGAAVASR